MSFTTRALAAAAGAVAVLGLTVVPAQADNSVLHNNGVSGKYVDVTDQLCARTSQAGTYAEVLIMSGSTIKFRVIDRTVDGAWKCTGNLSIPEDQKYTLSVLNCDKSTLACFGKRTTFYS